MPRPALGVFHAALGSQRFQVSRGAGLALLAVALSTQLLLAQFAQLAGHRHQLPLLRPELLAAFRAEAGGAGHGAEALGAGLHGGGLALLALAHALEAPLLLVEVVAETLDVADVIEDHRSISVGGRGASFNIPVSRSGGPRTTVGLPGTGLSWSLEHTPDRSAAIPAGPAAGLPNSRRLRPGQLDALKQSLLEALRRELFAPDSTGEQLWDHGLVSRLLADGSLPARTSGLLALIETPEAMEAYVLRAQGQDDAKRRAQRCITAVQEAARLANGWG